MSLETRSGYVAANKVLIAQIILVGVQAARNLTIWVSHVITDEVQGTIKSRYAAFDVPWTNASSEAIVASMLSFRALRLRANIG